MQSASNSTGRPFSCNQIKSSSSFLLRWVRALSIPIGGGTAKALNKGTQTNAARLMNDLSIEKDTPHACAGLPFEKTSQFLPLAGHNKRAFTRPRHSRGQSGDVGPICILGARFLRPLPCSINTRARWTSICFGRRKWRSYRFQRLTLVVAPNGWQQRQWPVCSAASEEEKEAQLNYVRTTRAMRQLRSSRSGSDEGRRQRAARLRASESTGGHQESIDRISSTTWGSGDEHHRQLKAGAQKLLVAFLFAAANAKVGETNRLVQVSWRPSEALARPLLSSHGSVIIINHTQ